MRPLLLGLTLAAIAWAVACSAQPYDQDSAQVATAPEAPAGFNAFYESLSPYGTWLDLGPWGQVWQPSLMPANWRPYTLGHWVYSDDGWTWISDFEWGWAPFHYGRWFFDPYYGWVWIPGEAWGPAWVAWRRGEGFIGWAPLPPWVGWEAGAGFTVGSFDSLIPRHDWVFCGERDLAQRHLRELLFPGWDNDRYLRRTHDVTYFRSVDGRMVDRSVDAEAIARASGRRVPRVQLVDRRLPGPTQEHGHTVELYRPRLISDDGQSALGQLEPGRERRSPPSSEDAGSLHELDRRQEEEAHRLWQRQEMERRAMEERHRREMNHPGDLRREEIQRHQEIERRELEQRQKRERRQLQSRFEQERRRAGSHR